MRWELADISGGAEAAHRASIQYSRGNVNRGLFSLGQVPLASPQSGNSGASLNSGTATRGQVLLASTRRCGTSGAPRGGPSVTGTSRPSGRQAIRGQEAIRGQVIRGQVIRGQEVIRGQVLLASTRAGNPGTGTSRLNPRTLPHFRDKSHTGNPGTGTSRLNPRTLPHFRDKSHTHDDRPLNWPGWQNPARHRPWAAPPFLGTPLA